MHATIKAISKLDHHYAQRAQLIGLTGDFAVAEQNVHWDMYLRGRFTPDATPTAPIDFFRVKVVFDVHA